MSNLHDLITVDVTLKDNNTLKINIIPFKRSLQRFVLMSIKPDLLKLLGRPINNSLMYQIRELVWSRIISMVNSGYIVDKKIIIKNEEFHDWKMADGMDDYLEDPLEAWKDRSWKEDE